MQIKKISKSRTRSRRAMFRVFLRWFLYAVVLLLFYLSECNPLIPRCCPLLIIPLATAVAMHESDFSAAMFGAFCGLMLDMASGTIIGFSSLWLLALCPLISLLSQFWIKVNFVSHFLLTLGTSVVMGFFDFIFLHWVWERASSSISFVHTILPAYGGAVLFAIPVYILMSLIFRHFKPKEERRLEESAQTAEETEEKLV